MFFVANAMSGTVTLTSIKADVNVDIRNSLRVVHSKVGQALWQPGKDAETNDDDPNGSYQGSFFPASRDMDAA